jgi:hypothetical protein
VLDRGLPEIFGSCSGPASICHGATLTLLSFGIYPVKRVKLRCFDGTGNDIFDGKRPILLGYGV